MLQRSPSLVTLEFLTDGRAQIIAHDGSKLNHP